MDSISIIILVSIVGWVIGVLSAAYVFSLFFKVKQTHWIQQKQLDVLITMAYKAGMSEEKLQEIMYRKIE